MKSLAFGLGLAVFAIGLSALLGYCLGATHLYRWDNGDVGMAVNTSCAFTLTGIALCILSTRQRHPQLK